MAKPIPANILQEQKALKEARVLNKGQENFYRIWQSYCSPYSYKVMTYMNYKGIPYKRMESDMTAMAGEITKLVGQSIIPVLLTPDEQVMQDSTPILEHFESQFPEKPTVPEDERLAFIMWLLEEFSDEYMPRIHMHTRWGNEQNNRTMGHRLARFFTLGNPSMTSQSLGPVISKRQEGFNKHLGLLGDGIKENMDQQILDLLAILEEHFSHHQFLLGFKPSMADFALFGPLKIHLFNDPQSNEIMELHGPRTCRWMDTISELGDTRGCAGQTEFGDWIDLDQGVPESLQKLLDFVGKTYIPFAKACALAGKDRNKSFTTNVYGVEATFSVHQYRVWSFEQLQLKYQSLTGQNRHFIDELLTATQILPRFMEGEIVHNALFDGFTPPFIKDGIADARAKHLKDKGKKVTGV
jgi:glutathione S-transferase